MLDCIRQLATAHLLLVALGSWSPAVAQGPPVLSSATPTPSWSPSTVILSGAGFLEPLEVQVGGSSVSPTRISLSEIRFVPPDLGPGDADITVKTPFGEATLNDGLLYHPAIEAPPLAQLGQVLHIEVGDVASGPFLLAASAQLLPVPAALSGLFLNELRLDPATSIAVPGWPGVWGPTTGVDVPVPNDPALSGSAVFVQGLGSAGALPGGSGYAFTNATATFLGVGSGPGPFEYASDPMFLEVGQPASPNHPILGTVADAFSVAPAPPAGLFFNPSTGAVSGTPTEPTAMASHVVTAHNDFGSSQAALEIGVFESAFEVIGCSLGCTGMPSLCTTGAIHQNEELRFTLTQPVEPGSLNAQSFAVQMSSTGASVSGSYSLDPGDPRTVVFRPALSFDSTGSPVFAFAAGVSYTVRLPGANAGGAQMLLSVFGTPLATTFQCTVAATLGVQDAAPGAPVAAVAVDVVTAYDPLTGEPSDFALDVPAADATGVWLKSDVVLTVDDILNLATLVSPITGQAVGVEVVLDLDGDPLTVGDQSPIAGHWLVSVDPVAPRTVAVFDPTGGLPSSGSGTPKRQVVVKLFPTIADLVGNPLANPGTVAFTTEVVAYPQLVLPSGGEDFATDHLEDELRSGAAWGGGLLAPGVGGGAGYLGDLTAAAGETVTLSTQGPLPSVPGALHVFSGPLVVPLGATPSVPGVDPSVTVTDGVFPFAHVRVEEGGLLSFAGANAARLLARGAVIVEGLLDAGGSEPDQLGGHESDALAGGTGGPQWPPTLPTGTAEAQWNDFEASNVLTCSSDQLAQAGGGGAYATDGGAGVIDPPLLPSLPDPSIPTPDTPGALASSVPVDAAWRTLDPALGYLRGGAGGGGGGAGLHLTRANGLPLNCAIGIGGQPLKISTYFTHSGAGGGGGGGAAQVHAGKRVQVDGVLAATGGPGGRSLGVFVVGPFNPDRSAAPGGGGSGGALLVQASEVQLAAQPGRIDVTGGPGGDDPGASLGGAGGAGLVRLEAQSAADPALVAPWVAPFDAGDPLSTAILSTGPLTPKADGPTALSGAQSCWIVPLGSFVTLSFVPDDPVTGTLGWDLQLELAGFGTVSYRGANPLLGVSVEQALGTDLLGSNGAPIAVRFQGVRIAGVIADACDVDLETQILPGSLTGWVRHPAGLNGWWDHLGPAEAQKRSPNAIRWMIVFDGASPLVPELVQGVSRLEIAAQPD